jgi:hypothetical protein
MGKERDVADTLWTGQADNESVVDDGLRDAQNVSFRYDGECRRRPGLYNRLSLSATLLSELEHPVNGTYLVGASGGTLTGVRISDGTSTTLASGLNSALRGSFAKCNGRVYFCNDFDAVQTIERGDAAATLAGITGPAGTMGTPTTAAGNCELGTHFVRYRYSNSKTGYYSDASFPVSVTIASSTKKLTFSIANSGSNIDRSADAKVDTIVIEMTEASGSVYYKATTVANSASTVDVNLSDATLRTTQPVSYYGDDGHQPPPVTMLACEHRGRVFYWGTSEHAFTNCSVTNGSPTITIASGFSANWGGRLVQVGTDTTVYPISTITSTTITLSSNYAGSTSASATITIYSSQYDTLYWSRAGYPEECFPTRWARRVLQNKSDKPAGQVSFYNDLYLFGQYSMRRFIYDKDPATAMLENIPGVLGVYNQACLVEAEGRLFGFGRAGAWVISGILPQHISRPVDKSVEERIDRTYADKFHGFFDPQERAVYFAYVVIGDTNPRNFFKLEVDKNKWSLGTWRQPLTASCITGSSGRVVQPYLADANGYVWNIKEDHFDGLPPSMTSGIVTVDVGATTTSIPTVESLSTSPNLAGAILYNPATGEEKLISSNSANTITCAAFSGAPSQGTPLYIGSIPVSITSAWWTGTGMNRKMRPRYLRMAWLPGTTSGSWTVKVYQNFSATPVTFTQFPDDKPPDGVTITNGGTSITVNFAGSTSAPDGFVEIPMPADWVRALRFVITTATPVDAMRLVAVWFDIERGETNAAEGE